MLLNLYYNFSLYIGKWHMYTLDYIGKIDKSNMSGKCTGY